MTNVTRRQEAADGSDGIRRNFHQADHRAAALETRLRVLCRVAARSSTPRRKRGVVTEHRLPARSWLCTRQAQKNIGASANHSILMQDVSAEARRGEKVKCGCMCREGDGMVGQWSVVVEGVLVLVLVVNYLPICIDLHGSGLALGNSLQCRKQTSCSNSATYVDMHTQTRCPAMRPPIRPSHHHLIPQAKVQSGKSR